MYLGQQESCCSEEGGDHHDNHDQKQFEFFHAPIMRRVKRNSDPQLPLLLSLPQRYDNRLNRTYFLPLDPDLDLFAFGPPALADLEARNSLLPSGFMPLIEPERDGSNGKPEQLGDLFS